MQKYSSTDFDRDFPDDEACLRWLWAERFAIGGDVSQANCTHCGEITSHYRLTNRPAWSCERCGRHVYPMAGTIFERSTTPLRLWFRAIAAMAVTRCGISSRALGRDLGVTVKTSYRMWHQIRSILKEEGDPFTGVVEADETYVGGLDRNRHANKRSGSRGRGNTGKTAVVGIVERGGRVVAKVVPNTGRAVIEPFVAQNVLPGARVNTDEYNLYNQLTPMGYDHQRVKHLSGIYVVGDDIHTNTMEGFWSQLKRSIDGTYHHVTAGHLQDYVDEYAFRYSHRNDSEPMFKTMLAQVVHWSREA